MTNAPDFASILNKPMTETEKPKPLPVGTYLAMVDGQPEFDKSAQKQTPFVRFKLKVIQAQDDVDQEALAAMPGGWQGKTLNHTLYLTEDSLWRLKDFLIQLGLEEDTGYNQAIADSPGRQIYAVVRHRSSSDGQSVFAEIASTAAV